MGSTIDLILRTGLGLFTEADNGLSVLMTQAGIDPRWQTLVLVAVFAVIFVAVLRSASAWLGALVLVVLLLLVLQRTSPDMLNAFAH